MKNSATDITVRRILTGDRILSFNLNNHKIPVKTQHISIMLYSDMFRLEGVIIRLPLEPYLICTTLLCTHGIPNVHSYFVHINPYPTAFPYGNGMVLHFSQQQESSTTKTVHKVINEGLKAYV